MPEGSGDAAAFQEAEWAARRAQAAADITRITLLSVLAAAGEALCVSDLVNILNREQSLVSHPLAVLHRVGLLDRRKRGKLAYCQPTDLGRELLAVFAAES